MSSANASRFRKRLRVWLEPPRQLRPTRAGWCFLLIILGVGFAALNTGNNLLYLVLSLLLAFLVLSGVLSESALRGIQIRRSLPREIFAAGANGLCIEIHNAQRRIPAFAIVVEDRSQPNSPPQQLRNENKRKDEDPHVLGRVFALRVGPGSIESRRYAVHPAERGVFRFHSFKVSTRFPFGLFLKSRIIDAPQDALVYPAIEPDPPAPRRDAGSEHAESAPPHGGIGVEVTGLREFIPGDSPRRIHWKRSLRSANPVVIERSDEQDAQIEVLLRTRPDPERFEGRVTRAASEVVAHLDAGFRVALTTEGEHFPAACGARQRSRLLSFLALVELPRSGEPTEAANHPARAR